MEDSLELHPVPLPLGIDGLCTLPSSQRSERDAPLDRTVRLPLPFYHHISCRAGDLWATSLLPTDPQLGLRALWVTGMLSTSPQAPMPSQARNHPQIVPKSLNSIHHHHLEISRAAFVWSYPRSVDGLRLGIQAVHCGGWGFSVGHILLS
jgi:hypothetical protein